MTPSQLKRWRKKHGCSQAELSLALGVHVRTISKWEIGVRGIPPFLYLALESLERKGVKK